MMTMNCFAEWLTGERHLRLISRRDHCQRLSPSQISDTSQAGFESAQNLSSNFAEWSWAVVINTTPRCHNCPIQQLQQVNSTYVRQCFRKAFMQNFSDHPFYRKIVNDWFCSLNHQKKFKKRSEPGNFLHGFTLTEKIFWAPWDGGEFEGLSTTKS